MTAAVRLGNELKEAGQAGVSVNRMLLLKAQAKINRIARQVRRWRRVNR